MNTSYVLLICSMLLALISGANQIFGVFSKINVATVVLSLVLAVVIIVFLPGMLSTEVPASETVLGMSPTLACYLGAALILIVGVAPFTTMYLRAEQASWQGKGLFERGSGSAALVPTRHAARLFNKIGLQTHAARAHVTLAQIHAGRLDLEQARASLTYIDTAGVNDAAQQAQADIVRGIIAYQTGHLLDAQRSYQQARQNIEKDTIHHAALLQNSAAVTLDITGDANAARIDYEHASDLYQRLADANGQAQILVNLAILPDVDPATGLSLLEEATSLAPAAPAKLQGTIWLNRGLLLRRQSSWDDAESAYANAEKHFQDAADAVGQAQVLLNQAALSDARGNAAIARNQLLQAKARFATAGTKDLPIAPMALARLTSFQADLFDVLGDSTEAEEAYQAALKHIEQVPNPALEANTRINYAGFLQRSARQHEALNELSSGMELLREYCSQEAIAIALNNRGKLFQDLGDYDTATFYYQESLQILEALGDRLGGAQSNENLAILRAFKGAADPEPFERALAIYRELGQRDLEAKTLLNIYTIGTRADTTALIKEILTLLDTHKIDQHIQTAILTRVLPQDIKAHDDLIRFRERLAVLERDKRIPRDAVDRGLILLQLARIEQGLMNFARSREYAAVAEPFAPSVPLPARIQFLTDLGFFLAVDENPERGIEHFWSALDLTLVEHPNQAQSIMTVLGLKLAEYDDVINRSEHRLRLERVLASSDDSLIREQASNALEALTR